MRKSKLDIRNYDNIEYDLPSDHHRKVYCVETDETFDSVESAMESVQCNNKEAIISACMTHTMAFGYHWLWE